VSKKDRDSGFTWEDDAFDKNVLDKSLGFKKCRV